MGKVIGGKADIGYASAVTGAVVHEVHITFLNLKDEGKKSAR